MVRSVTTAQQIPVAGFAHLALERPETEHRFIAVAFAISTVDGRAQVVLLTFGDDVVRRIGLQQQCLRAVSGHLLTQGLVRVVQQSGLATVLKDRAQLLALIKAQGRAFIAVLRGDQVIVTVIPVLADDLTRGALDIQQAILSVIYE